MTSTEIAALLLEAGTELFRREGVDPLTTVMVIVERASPLFEDLLSFVKTHDASSAAMAAADFVVGLGERVRLAGLLEGVPATSAAGVLVVGNAFAPFEIPLATLPDEGASDATADVLSNVETWILPVARAALAQISNDPTRESDPRLVVVLVAHRSSPLYEQFRGAEGATVTESLVSVVLPRERTAAWLDGISSDDFAWIVGVGGDISAVGVPLPSLFADRVEVGHG